MYGLRSWDPLTAELSRSSYELALTDRASLSRISTELVRMYEGNQLGYVLTWLTQHIRDEKIRQRYSELAVFHNVVRLLVDRVSTLGQLPIRCIWEDPDGTPNGDAQALWDEVVYRWMGDVTWDAFIPSLQRRVELCKTAVAAVAWDPMNREIALSYYTPNQVDVGYVEGNMNPLHPDRYYLLREDATKLVDIWDMTEGKVMQREGEGSIDEIGDQPVIDPVTKKPAVPFVAFRTDVAATYFIWDGQLELRNAQEFTNRLLTRLSVLLEMGANKVMVLSGEGWADAEGNIPPIPMDITKAIKEPEAVLSGDSGRPKVRWDGPSVAAEITAILDALSFWIEATAATFRINPSAIRAKNEATSGYALQIEAAALKGKHASVRTLSLRPLTRLAELIRLYWDFYTPTGKKFPAQVRPHVLIPDYSGGVTVREEVDADIALVGAKLKRRLPLIYKYEPGIPPEAAAELADEGDEAPTPATPAVPPVPPTVPAPPGPVDAEETDEPPVEAVEVDP